MCTKPGPAVKNRYLNVREIRLIRQLRHKGLPSGRVPGFFWSLKSCLLDNPGASPRLLNRQLEELGWGDVLLDDHTLQLARAAVNPLEEVSS